MEDRLAGKKLSPWERIAALEETVFSQRGMIRELHELVLEVQRAVSQPVITEMVHVALAPELTNFRERSSEVVALLGYQGDCAEQRVPVTREGLHEVILKLRATQREAAER